MENRLEISLLMDYYGSLLTEKQVNVMSMYFDEDLSLGEIADLNNISRQAIHDLIKRTRKQLLNFEDKLRIREESLRIKSIKAEIKELIEEGSGNNKDRLLNLVSSI